MTDRRPEIDDELSAPLLASDDEELELDRIHDLLVGAVVAALRSDGAKLVDGRFAPLVEDEIYANALPAVAAFEDLPLDELRAILRERESGVVVYEAEPGRDQQPQQQSLPDEVCRDDLRRRRNHHSI